MDKDLLITFLPFSLIYLIIAILIWFLPATIINKLIIVYIFILPIISIVLGIIFLFFGKKEYAYGSFASLLSGIIMAIINMGIGFGATIGRF